MLQLSSSDGNDLQIRCWVAPTINLRSESNDACIPVSSLRKCLYLAPGCNDCRRFDSFPMVRKSQKDKRITGKDQHPGVNVRQSRIRCMQGLRPKMQ